MTRESVNAATQAGKAVCARLSTRMQAGGLFRKARVVALDGYALSWALWPGRSQAWRVLVQTPNGWIGPWESAPGDVRELLEPYLVELEQLASGEVKP